MTVIAARVMKDGIHFAADKQVTYGRQRVTSKEMKLGKLKQVNGMTIGGAGLTAQSQLFCHFAANHKPASANEFSVVEFILEFQNWMKAKDAAFVFHNDFLLAIDKKLFSIEGSMSVFEVPSFAAIGSGRDYALAAMHIGNIPSAAVKVAADLDICCGRGVDHVVHDFN